MDNADGNAQEAVILHGGDYYVEFPEVGADLKDGDFIVFVRKDNTGDTQEDGCANAIDAALTTTQQSTGALAAQDAAGANSYVTATGFDYGGRLATHASLKAPHDPVKFTKVVMAGVNDTHDPLNRPHDNVMDERSFFHLCLARLPDGEDPTTWTPTSGSDYVIYKNIYIHIYHLPPSKQIAISIACVFPLSPAL